MFARLLGRATQRQWCATEASCDQCLLQACILLREEGGWGNCYWGTPVLSGRGYPQGAWGMMRYNPRECSSFVTESGDEARRKKAYEGTIGEA